MPSHLIVTGGAGYVGSAVARRLEADGFRVTIVDDLSAGHPAAIPGARIVRGDIASEATWSEALGKGGADGCVHCASRIQVGESVRDPLLYYRENLEKPVRMAAFLAERGVRRILFSSSAAVYGEPERTPIDEDHPLRPVNPYGRSKAYFERFLEDLEAAGQIGRVSLRYFNAAGASADGLFGEDHRPESHLIPLLFRAAIEGATMPVFGTDYPTPDGTCVRDYVHVEDLAEAHVLAWRRLERGDTGVYNLGGGEGVSVRRMLLEAERACGLPIRIEARPRRPGDAAVLVASRSRAERDLGWVPKRGLTEILESAWRWHRTHTSGYPT